MLSCYLGAQKSEYIEKTLLKIESFISFLHSYSFDDIAAKEYGIIRATLEMSGNIIGPNDLMIASIAKANNLKLVTNNTKEFNRVPDLIVEDWSL
jgi:tRNA(fMet)-specific endonuclease VapC